METHRTDVAGDSRLITDDFEATTATTDAYRSLAQRVAESGGTPVGLP